MTNADFLSKEPSTRERWASVLKIAENEGGLGGCSVQVIRPAIIQGFLDGLADKPGNQSIARTALKQVEAFALVRDLVPYPFMTGTTVIGSDGGFEPWSFAQVEIAEKYAKPHLARVVTLMVHTGQRGSDIVKMRWTDIEKRDGRDGINVVQKKTGRRLWVPFTSELSTAMGAWERKPPFFLVLKPDGNPYTREILSVHWYYEIKNNDELEGLADLVLHGLRATAVVRARKSGATVLEIASMYGMSEQMVARYSRLAEQGEMAMAAVIRLDRTAGERNPKTVKQLGS